MIQKLIKNIKNFKNHSKTPMLEERILWGNFPLDYYKVDMNFSENTAFEVGKICLEGKKFYIEFDFPFCHCYRTVNRKLATLLYQVPQSSSDNMEYPIYKIANSLFVDQVVCSSGGVLEKDKLEHYQILSLNLVIDIILYKGEEILFEKKRRTGDEMD